MKGGGREEKQFAKTPESMKSKERREEQKSEGKKGVEKRQERDVEE